MHFGSGIGNQLHSYLATRILALDKGFKFGIAGREYFKGKDFMNLDMGEEIDFPICLGYPAGKVIVETPYPLWEEKTDYYNPEMNFVEDNTVIDGCWQDERYWEHREKEVDEWLKVKEWNIPDDVCVIGLRGGEYYTDANLGLPLEWYYRAMGKMIEINPQMKFEIHTDDAVLAKQWFPKDTVVANIELNWRAMRYAKYAIIANSSFYILPRWLRNGVTIAPRYWARHNIKTWSMPQNYYKRFTYI